MNAEAGLTCSTKWSGRQDSNLRPTVPKTVALPGCATPRLKRRLSTANQIEKQFFVLELQEAQAHAAEPASIAGWRISLPTEIPNCFAMPPLISNTNWMFDPPGMLVRSPGTASA